MKSKSLAFPSFIALAFVLLSGAPAWSKTSVQDHVMLRFVSGGDDPPCGFGAFFRLFPDGSLSPSPFVVPKGRVLVITDFVWSAIDGFSALTPGMSLRAALDTYSAPATDFSRVFESDPVYITTENQDGRLGTNSKIESGVMVGPGRLICPFATESNQLISATVGLDEVFVYGHLLRDH